jgi:hypothetical protein
MKERYRLFLRRKSVYYAFDNTTKTFQSLKTKNEAEANRLLAALNDAGRQPALNLSLARVYLKHSDPMVSQRTWQHVLNEIITLKSGPTQYRWQTAAKDKAFDLIRARLLIETQAEHFLEVLKRGTISTNVHLRKMHNFALNMNWLPWSVLAKRCWPAVHFKPKRGVSFQEHQQIRASERNPEWRASRELSGNYLYADVGHHQRIEPRHSPLASLITTPSPISVHQRRLAVHPRGSISQFLCFPISAFPLRCPPPTPNPPQGGHKYLHFFMFFPILNHTIFQPAMRTAVPEKILNVIDDIDTYGNVPLTRLTVLKKWFEEP